MGRQQSGDLDYTEPQSEAGEFAGWDPYVIWLCKQFTAPAEAIPADSTE